MLVLTIIIMGIGTFLIGLLPTYVDRHRSADSARPPAIASGYRHRRRVGRSRADGRRECAG
jgi:hypothetical protein